MVKRRRRGKVVEVEMIRWSNRGKRLLEFAFVLFVHESVFVACNRLRFSLFLVTSL